MKNAEKYRIDIFNASAFPNPKTIKFNKGIKSLLVLKLFRIYLKSLFLFVILSHWYDQLN